MRTRKDHLMSIEPRAPFTLVERELARVPAAHPSDAPPDVSAPRPEAPLRGPRPRGADSTRLLPQPRRRVKNTPGGVAIEEDGCYRVKGGPLHCALAVTPLTLECYAASGQDNIAAELGRMARDLDPGYTVQILVESRPLDGRAVLDDYVRRLRPQHNRLRELGALQRQWLAAKLRDGHVSDLAHYVIVDAPSPSGRGCLQVGAGRRRTERRALEQAAETFTGTLERMGLSVRQLGGEEIFALLWSGLHPSGTPCPGLSTVVAEAMDLSRRQDDEERARAELRREALAAARLRVARSAARVGLEGPWRHLRQRLDDARRRFTPFVDRAAPDRLAPLVARSRQALPAGSASVDRRAEFIARHVMERLCAIEAQEGQGTLHLDGQIAHSTFALKLPDTTSPGFPDALYSLDCPYRAAIHLEGRNITAERKRLERRHRTMYLIQADGAGHGPENILLRATQEENARQILELRGNKAGVARMGFYLTLTAPDPDALEDSLERAASAFGATGIDPGTGLGAQLPLLQATLPLGCDPTGLRRRYRTETIGNTFPFTSHTPGHTRGLPVGFTKTGKELVLFDPFDPTLPNQVMNIVGMSGRGKTFLALRMLLDMLLIGGRATVIDRAGSYRWLSALVGGSTVELGSQVNPPAINMWDHDGAGPSVAKIAWLVRAHEIMLATNPGDKLDPVKLSFVSRGIRAVYDGFRAPDAARDTDRPADGTPLERDLVAWLAAEALNPARADDERARLRELAAGLEPYVNGAEHASLLDRATTVDFEARLLLIDTQQLGNEITKIHAIALHIITDAVERRATAAQRAERGALRLREMLIIDEGWHLIKYGAGGAFINNLARQGRALGLWLVFITQQLSDLVNDSVAAGLFNAASVSFLYEMSDEGAGVDGGMAWLARTLHLNIEEVEQIGRLKQGTERDYAEMFMLRKSSYAGTDRRGVVQVMSSPYEYWLFTSKPEEKDKRKAMVDACDGDVWRAVKALARDEAAPTPAAR